MYINELGRLFIHFGKPARALRCFSEAAEIKVEHAREAEKYQLPLQTKMLIASAVNTGYICWLIIDQMNNLVKTADSKKKK